MNVRNFWMVALALAGVATLTPPRALAQSPPALAPAADAAPPTDESAPSEAAPAPAAGPGTAPIPTVEAPHPPATASTPAPPPSQRPATVYHGRMGDLEVTVPRIEADIDIDGAADEPAWADAAILTGFSQYDPVDGSPAADSTEVRVVYDDYAIYFAVKAFEPNGRVVATLADRDRIDGNDHVQIILDTFNDRRRALVFSSNALGIQSDGTLADGADTDLSPDFIYESHGRLTPDGYEIEMRVPFKSIRYQQSEAQVWGIQVVRKVMHSGYTQTWTAAERSAPSFLGQSGTLVGLTGLRRGLVLDVNPVMTARADGAPQASPATGWDYDAESPEFGGTLRWGVTPNASLSATVNPDFSQVEADVGQVIYDPRSAVSFPEKRPFFLEASENFEVPNSLIYTRRLVQPEGAAKLSGKMGEFNVGLLSAIDGPPDLGEGDDSPLFNLVRLRRDVGPQSNVGVVYTDWIQGSDYNRVMGLDTRLLLGERWVFNGQVASSFSRFGGEGSSWKPLFDFSLSQSGRDRGMNLVVEGRHPEFVTRSGFVPRTGIAHANFSPRWSWYPENSLFESISFTPQLDGTWVWDRFLDGTFPDDIKVNSSTNLRLRGGWGLTLYHWSESFSYPDYLYTNYFIERRDEAGEPTDTVPYVGTDRLTNLGLMVAVNTPQWNRFSGRVQVIGGQDDNFDEWSSAWILYTTIEANWNPTDQIRMNGRFLEQRVHRKTDGSLVRLRTIPRVKLEYQVSRPIFLRFVGQYDGLKVDALRDDSRTGDPILIRTPDGFRPAVASERGGFRMDWLFSYQPNPGTVFFAGYGSSLDGDELWRPNELTRTSDGFFLKVSYLLRM
ncbi:DUF5916 domain-containing protein [Gemmatimonadota bacterium DH-20]|uniref:DUF5916 domain-containing protein n=2 Tax=Gaopeijia maritima TaxID=3119007 RepID=A0ABU9EB32_9BACT